MSTPDSVESGEDGPVPDEDEKLSDINFWRKLVHDESLLTTGGLEGISARCGGIFRSVVDPDAKEDKSELSVNELGTRKTRYAGNFLRFRTARSGGSFYLDSDGCCMCR